MNGEKKQAIFANGWGTKILTTTIALLLVGAITTTFSMYGKLEQVMTKLDTIQERMDRIDERVQRLELDRWRETRL